MNSYTLTMVLLFAAMMALDVALSTKLVKNMKFWLLLSFVCGMTVLFDAYASGTIWHFNPAAVMGIYILDTPIENLLFGMSLIGISVILFEHSNAT